MRLPAAISPLRCPGRAPHASLHRVCVRVAAASSSAFAIPCVDVALNRNASREVHETRTPWDWIIRLPPLNVCVDAAFTVSGFLLLPMLYRTFRGHGPTARKLPSLAVQPFISEFSGAAETQISGVRVWQRAVAVMIGSRFYTCMFGLLWLWASSGACCFSRLLFLKWFSRNMLSDVIHPYFEL